MSKRRKSDNDARELNDTYRMLRYWIHFDGTLNRYAYNYGDRYLRFYRIMFLEQQQEEHVQLQIDAILSKTP